MPYKTKNMYTGPCFGHSHSRPQRLRSIWPAPWIETSGRLQSVLVTDWSDANTIKSDKPEKKHEAWRKDNNKPNFCGNVRLQGKYYKQKPSVRFTWKAMKEGIGRALEIFFRYKNFFSDRLPSRKCRTHQIAGVLEDGSSFKSPKGVDYSIQTREHCTRKPGFHHFTRCGK